MNVSILKKKILKMKVSILKKNTENEGKQGVTPGACPSLRDIRLSERVIALLVENLKFAIN